MRCGFVFTHNVSWMDPDSPGQSHIITLTLDPMQYPFLDLDSAVEDIFLSINTAINKAKECGDPSEWEQLAELIECLEEAREIVSFPPEIEESIQDAQAELEDNFFESFDDHPPSDPEWK